MIKIPCLCPPADLIDIRAFDTVKFTTDVMQNGLTNESQCLGAPQVEGITITSAHAHRGGCTWSYLLLSGPYNIKGRVVGI